MGYSKAQKTRTHKRIVSIASKRFREKGLAGLGIAELMKEAGLTVGGFYKHFGSRDDLVAEAVNSAFGGWQRRLDAAKSGGASVSLAKLIDEYLNETHRDNPGSGCAFSALAPEIARSDKRTRSLTSEQVRGDLQLIATLLPGRDKRAARSRAILIFSALVGAMSLARAVSDEALSREILETVGELLKNSAVNQSFRQASYRRPSILPQFR
jgi:TetR/AcrR family transcriptional regulator, transcriptional repressor for nem operon